MTPEQIYKNATQASDDAEKKFIDDNGEPPAYPPTFGSTWVIVTKGRQPFVTWLRKNNIGHKNQFSGSRRGWLLHYHYAQSLDVSYAGAKAFAKYLSDNGIDAYPSCKYD